MSADLPAPKSGLRNLLNRGKYISGRILILSPALFGAGQPVTAQCVLSFIGGLLFLQHLALRIRVESIRFTQLFKRASSVRFPARKSVGLSLDPRPDRTLLLSEFIGLICQIIQLLLPGDLITEICQLTFIFQGFVFVGQQ